MARSSKFSSGQRPPANQDRTSLNPDVAIGEAIAAYREKRFGQAERICLDLIDAGDSSGQAYSLLGVLAGKQKKLKEARDLLRRAIEASPGVALYHHNLGMVLLQGGEHAACLEAFGRAAELQGPLIGRLGVYRNSVIDEAQAAGGLGYVAALDNVLVDTGHWSIFDRDRVYSRETMGKNLFNNPLIGRRATDDRSFVVANVPQATRKIERPCVFLGGDDNYSHWLTRNLARLSLLESRPDLAGLPLLINEDLQTYQRDALEILGISDDRLIRLARWDMVECDRLYVPTNLRGEARKLRPGIEWLRHRLMMPGAADARHGGERRLYISREDSSRRRLLNETELISALRPLGFEAIVPGRMTFRDQIQAFSEASFIVSPHGAALANLVFAPRGCRVAEISPRPIAYMNDFRIIADVLDLQLETLITDDVEYYSKIQNQSTDYDFSVEIGNVVNAVSRALDRQRS